MSAESAQTVKQPSERRMSLRISKQDLVGVVLPHLVMIVAQLPLSTIAYVNLWKSAPHYRFFPFLFAAVLYLIYARWPRTEHPFVKSTFANVLLVGGIVFSVGATAFVNPTFASASVICLIGSILARTRDKETGRTLVSIWWLLPLGIQLPLGTDVELITWLQRVSARCTSLLLDVFGYPHDMPGTILVFPQKSYFVEEACSGVQSFFTLLFCSALYCVWARRGLMHSLALIALAVFWAIVMNIMRIFLIPIFDVELDIDLTKGLPHDLLGYFVLFFALLMVASTDRLLSFFFDPVPLDGPSAAARYWRIFVDFITFAKLRKSIRSRRQELGRQHADRHQTSITTRGLKILNWGLAIFIAATAIIQTLDASRMFRKNYRVAFGLDTIVELAEQDLPTEIGRWQCVAYERLDRPLASELGQRSDNWQFQSESYIGVASLDQPFPGWHELTVCYTNQGWIVDDQRVTHYEQRDDLGEPWAYVEVGLTNTLGERGYLLFSFFDVLGRPIEAPDTSSGLSLLFQRIKNRLNVRIRERLFNAEAYQAQVFVHSSQPLTEEDKQEVIDNYLEVRETLRSKFEQMNREATNDST